MTYGLQNRLDTLSIKTLPNSIVIGSLIVFALSDMSSFGVGDIERAAYATVLACAVFGALTSIRFAAIDRSAWVLMSAWCLVTAGFFLGTASQRDVYLNYVSGDALSLLLPLLFLVSAWLAPGLFSRHSLVILGGGLLLAALLGVAAGRSGQRFEPPPTLLLALSAWGLIAARGLRLRVLLGSGMLALGYLALASGQRTALLIWLCCSFYAVWQAAYQPRWRLVTVILGLSVGAAFLATAARDLAVDALSGYRAVAVSQSATDASMLTRIAEGGDVLATMWTDGDWLNWAIGFGHGATYEPNLSYVERNLTPEGRVHNVHIGPLLLLFRYGLLGLAAYILLLLSLLPSLMRGLRPHDTAAPDVFAFCVGAYLVEGLMFNILVDPLFSYSLAGFLYYRLVAGR